MVTKVVIGDKFYDMPAKQAAKRLNINYSTLMDRVKNPKPKWDSWRVADLDSKIVINGRNYADIDEAILTLSKIKKRINKIKKIVE